MRYKTYDYNDLKYVPEVATIWIAKLNFATIIPKWEACQVQIDTNVIMNSYFYNISMYRFASFKKSEVEKYCNNLNDEIKKQQDSDVESVKSLYKMRLLPYQRSLYE